MSTQTDFANDHFNGRPPAPAPLSETKPLYWSVRRELWENRSIYLAPLIVFAVVLFSTLIMNFGLPRKIRSLDSVDPAKRHTTIVRAFSMAPAPIMFTTILVGMFYSLDALYGERRERSILFWKSLPVSDRTAVFSKALIPLAVLPFIGFALGLAAQFILLCEGTMILAGSGMSPATLWGEFHYPQEPLIMLYGMAVHALWFAPIYGWLMLVSAWARRAPFLWGVVPLLLPMAVEKIAFNTTFFGQFLRYRFMGAMGLAFAPRGKTGIIDIFAQLSPGRFLSSPGLWLGLLFAAACFAAAIRLRGNREPL